MTSMTNEQAFEYGRQAGRAINERDQARYNHLAQWFRSAIEIEEHKVELRTMYDAGYKEVRDQHFNHIKPTIKW